MKTKNLKQKATFKTTPHDVYEALMDAKKHSLFSGSKAKITRKVGDKFSCNFGKSIKISEIHIIKMKKQNNYEKATFAAGCFWGVEEEFRQIQGVISTQVGYTGGNTENPTYEHVCSDETGHAEAVEVTFNPNKVSYEKLLEVFWNNHNPTQGNRQGPDVGTQYRSAIFYHNKKQKELAEKSMKEEQKKYKKPITTEIMPATTFYRAEEYHQQYLEKRGMSTCHI